MLAQAIQTLVAWAARQRIPAQITSGYRTHSQQRALYSRYLRGLNPYPVAPPGTSDHEFGLAVDLWAGSDELTDYLGRAWKAAGGLWDVSDRVHFSLRH